MLTILLKGREWSFLFHNDLEEICIPSSDQFPLTQCEAVFSFLSPHCHHKPLQGILMTILNWHFNGLLMFPFKYLPQIFFQISETSLAKSEETTQASS